MLTLALCTTISGQKRISGYVEDAQSREKLFGATILIPGTTTGTTTNFYGYFSLQLPPDQKDISVSYVGYQTSTYSFNLRSDTTLTIRLETNRGTAGGRN